KRGEGERCKRMASNRASSARLSSNPHQRLASSACAGNANADSTPMISASAKSTARAASKRRDGFIGGYPLPGESQAWRRYLVEQPLQQLIHREPLDIQFRRQ